MVTVFIGKGPHYVVISSPSFKLEVDIMRSVKIWHILLDEKCVWFLILGYLILCIDFVYLSSFVLKVASLVHAERG